MPDKLMLQRKRLRALCETEVWKQDIKPFLLDKLQTSKIAIFHDESDLHWKGVGIYGHIEEFLMFVEELELEKSLWQRNEKNQKQKPKRNLLSYFKRRNKQ